MPQIRFAVLILNLHEKLRKFPVHLLQGCSHCTHQLVPGASLSWLQKILNNYLMYNKRIYRLLIWRILAQHVLHPKECNLLVPVLESLWRHDLPNFATCNFITPLCIKGGKLPLVRCSLGSENIGHYSQQHTCRWSTPVRVTV